MIDCSRDDGLWTLTLNRPEKANSLTAKMLEQLVNLLMEASVDPHLRALVITGAGDQVFSAGADLSEFASADSVFDARRIRWDRDPWGPMWDLPVPTIAETTEGSPADIAAAIGRLTHATRAINYLGLPTLALAMPREPSELPNGSQLRERFRHGV